MSRSGVRNLITESQLLMRRIFNMLITFFNLNAFFPLHLVKSVVEYIYNKKLTITTGVTL